MLRITWTEEDGAHVGRAADGTVVYTLTPGTDPAWKMARADNSWGYPHVDAQYLMDMADGSWRQEVVNRPGNPDPAATLMMLAHVLAEATADRYKSDTQALADVETVVLHGLKAAGVTVAPCENCGTPAAPLVIDPYLVDVGGVAVEQARRYLCQACLDRRSDDV